MDHYQILGVDRGATAAAVRLAYRKAAQIHHPDKGGDPKEFLKIAAAIEVLGDEKARREYDAMLQQRGRRPRFDKDWEGESPMRPTGRDSARSKEVAALPILAVAEVGVDEWSGAPCVLRHAWCDEPSELQSVAQARRLFGAAAWHELAEASLAGIVDLGSGGGTSGGGGSSSSNNSSSSSGSSGSSVSSGSGSGSSSNSSSRSRRRSCSSSSSN